MDQQWPPLRGGDEGVTGGQIDRPHHHNLLTAVLGSGGVSASSNGRLTFCDVHSERALGDLLAGEEHVDDVRALQHGPVGATEDAVALVLQDELHRVFLALGVDDDHAHVPVAGAWGRRRNGDGRQQWTRTTAALDPLNGGRTRSPFCLVWFLYGLYLLTLPLYRCVYF